MRFVFAILFISLIVQAKSIKISSYNVENLFDMKKSGLEYKDYVPNRHNWTEKMLHKKLNNLAEVICDLNADVIALQEVENDRVLERLQRVLKRVGCDYKYRAITDSKQTAIHNAILSKIALKKRKDIVVFRNSRHRSMLEVDLKTDPRLKIFVLHWKSKAGPESKRIVYAKALMKRISRLPKGSEYVVLGDFNANYDEHQTIDKKHNDTGGITGINHVLKTIKDGKLLRLHNMENGYHLNLWMELAPYARWSHNFYGDKEGLDAIIIPRTLNDDMGWEYKEDSFGVFKPKYLFGNKGQINRWEYKRKKHTGKGYSDHLPIYAVFYIGSDTKIQNNNKSFWEDIGLFFGLENTDTTQDYIKNTQPILNNNIKEADISDVYSIDQIDTPLSLKDVKVIFKSGTSAIIKQHEDGRGILLYRCAGDIKEGRRYDIVAYKKKIYKGLDELVDIVIDKELGSADMGPMIKKFESKMLFDKRYINEVVYNLQGVYKNRKIKILGKNFPIYFKRAANRPKDGSTIRLKRATIGYYKDHNQLVVWSEDDWQEKE